MEKVILTEEQRARALEHIKRNRLSDYSNYRLIEYITIHSLIKLHSEKIEDYTNEGNIIYGLTSYFSKKLANLINGSLEEKFPILNKIKDCKFEEYTHNYYFSSKKYTNLEKLRLLDLNNFHNIEALVSKETGEKSDKRIYSMFTFEDYFSSVIKFTPEIEQELSELNKEVGEYLDLRNDISTKVWRLTTVGQCFNVFGDVVLDYFIDKDYIPESIIKGDTMENKLKMIDMLFN